MKKLLALLSGDLRLVFRDTFLQFLVMYPLVLGLITRFLVPFVTERFTRIDLVQYHVLIGSIVITLQVVVLAGTVLGLMVLDEKDHGTLTALQVTPLPLGHYMAYRAGLPMAFSFLVSLLIVILLNSFLPQPPWGGMALVAILGFMPLPVYVFFISALAQNKVQGLALTKALGPFMILPVIAYFVPEPWQWLFGLAPTFWPAKAYWLLMDGDTLWAVLAGGLLCCGIWNWAWFNLFQRRVLRSFT